MLPRLGVVGGRGGWYVDGPKLDRPRHPKFDHSGAAFHHGARSRHDPPASAGTSKTGQMAQAGA